MCVFQVSLWREEQLEVMRVEEEVAARVREEEEARRREEEEREKRRRERDRAKVEIFSIYDVAGLATSHLPGIIFHPTPLQLDTYRVEKDYQCQVERWETEKRREAMRAWREEQAKRNKQRSQLISPQNETSLSPVSCDNDFCSLFIGWSIVTSCS